MKCLLLCDYIYVGPKTAPFLIRGWWNLNQLAINQKLSVSSTFVFCFLYGLNYFSDLYNNKNLSALIVIVINY